MGLFTKTTVTKAIAAYRGLSSQGYLPKGYLPKAHFHSAMTMKNGNSNENVKFDESMLAYIACPLSKSSLRYDAATNELVCDDIQVAYPIVNGIPNLLPQDARKLNTENSKD